MTFERQYDRAVVMPAIFERMRKGESLRSICLDESMPCINTVDNWLNEDAALLGQYTRARQHRGDYYADLSVAAVQEVPPLVGGENDHKAGESRMDSGFIAWKRLQSETYWRVAARMHPNQYAETVKQQVSGPDGGPQVHKVTVDYVGSTGATPGGVPLPPRAYRG